MGDFIDDFIQEYKRQPSLWQTGHPDFKNRKKRQEAYMKLIEVANKHNEVYNIERTKQKINNLRCAFRVQLKKYNEVKRNSKDGKEETYCPKRKYFESLMFLLNEETSAAKANEENKKTASKGNNEVVSRTRNKTLSRKKIDKELEAITLDLKDDIDTDENFLTNSVESEKENKLKSDSFEENEETFNLALIEDEENLSVCNTKEIDPDAFESIIEEDDQSNKESQADFVKVTKSSPSILSSKSTSTTQQANDVIKSKTPLVTKQSKSQLPEEKVVLIQSNPSTSTVTITSTSSSPSTTVATRSQFRQTQTKPPSHSNTKFSPLSHINNKNTRIVQVRSIKTLANNTLQSASSPPKATQQQSSSINSPQKRLSTGLATQPSVSSSITLSSPSSKAHIVSPIITQKVVTIPKVTPTPQQITIRSTQPQIPTRSATISSTGVSLAPHNNSNEIFHNNNDTMVSQTKKIKLDFDSSNLEKILSLACSKLKQEDNEDDFTVFGRMVTCKLKTMETDQALIAQRLITEVLFDGQMNILQPPQTNLQKTIASSLPQLITRTTPITSVRHLNTNGQTFYISDVNGNNNTNVDSNKIQFSTSNTNINSGDC